MFWHFHRLLICHTNLELISQFNYLFTLASSFPACPPIPTTIYNKLESILVFNLIQITNFLQHIYNKNQLIISNECKEWWNTHTIIPHRICTHDTKPYRRERNEGAEQTAWMFSVLNRIVIIIECTVWRYIIVRPNSICCRNRWRRVLFAPGWIGYA